MPQEVFARIEKLLVTPEPPELGPGPRRGIAEAGKLNQSCLEAFKGSSMEGENAELARAVVLLWHDHLDAAHELAQGVDGADGAFVHGVMHRREPDYGNAKYWFRRAGRHPLQQLMATATAPLDGRLGELRRRLLPAAGWDSLAFVDECEQANRAKAPAGQTALLRELQAVELRELLRWLCNGKEHS